MKRVVVREHGRIVRWTRDGPPPAGTSRLYLERRLYDRLKRFDQHGRPESDRVFAWGDGQAAAQQWVGVVQVPGLQLEVLPKVDALAPGEADAHDARRNLLYMLAVGGDVPVRSRDMARLTSRSAPLSETLSALFADRLLGELLKGPARAYVARQENLRRFKGKLLVAAQARHNAAHRERFFCRFDEFSDDTLMNRIFRSACLALLDATRTPATQELLRRCLLLLDRVSDVVVHDELFDKVVLTRQNERFGDVLQFCRLILSGRSPTAQSGRSRSFSLLFDMNHVFESFVAGFLRRHVLPRMEGYRLFPQARRRRRHLLSSEGRGVLALRPDLLVEAPDGSRVVLDTKWKRLSSTGSRGGVAAADLYQLFAYLHRYGCHRSVLLYPRASGISPRDFQVIDRHDGPSGEQVAVRFVDLNRDLHREAERSLLADELHELLTEAFSSRIAHAEASTAGGAA